MTENFVGQLSKEKLLSIPIGSIILFHKDVLSDAPSTDQRLLFNREEYIYLGLTDGDFCAKFRDQFRTIISVWLGFLNQMNITITTL